MADIVSGIVIGERYRAFGRLGSGGFGDVYLGEHVNTRQRIALKVLKFHPAASDEDLIARFFREAQTTAALKSPNTVNVFDIDQAPDDGPYYMAMELLVGPTLHDVLRALKKAGAVMHPVHALALGIEVLNSLAEAHDAGLVHRDLKPPNILLADAAGEEPLVKVLDFGVARTHDSSLTSDGLALGTPAYMSPEQANLDPVDGRADLYGLGVILYRCVTGQLPFVSSDRLAVMDAHKNKPPPDPRELAPQPLSDEVVELLGVAMAKNPADRYPDARSMQRALQDALVAMVGSRPRMASGSYLSVAADQVQPGDDPRLPSAAIAVERSDQVEPRLPSEAIHVDARSGITKTHFAALSDLLVVGDEDLMARARERIEQAARAQSEPIATGSPSTPRSSGGPRRTIQEQRAQPRVLTFGIAALVVLAAAAWLVANNRDAEESRHEKRRQQPPVHVQTKLSTSVVQAAVHATLAQQEADPTKAMALLRKAVELDPTNAEYQEQLRRMRQRAAAEGDARETPSRVPNAVKNADAGAKKPRAVRRAKRARRPSGKTAAKGGSPRHVRAGKASLNPVREPPKRREKKLGSDGLPDLEPLE